MLDSPFYVHHKKHYCEICNGELEVRRIKKTVNSNSPEAIEFDFSNSGGDGFLIGDVRFSFEVFFCPKCDKSFSIRQTKKRERESRMTRKNEKRKGD